MADISFQKQKSSPIELLSFLVAETGFEPRDLRVMRKGKES